MKKNVTKTESEDVKGMFWYSWDEYCDRCGKQIWKCGEKLSFPEPDMNEEDYCIDCYKELLEERRKNK